MYLMLWVENVQGWQLAPKVEPVVLTIEHERRPHPRLMYGRELVPHVVAALEGPDDDAEMAISLLLLPAMTRALVESWPNPPADGPSAVAELLRRACARPT